NTWVPTAGVEVRTGVPAPHWATVPKVSVLVEAVTEPTVAAAVPTTMDWHGARRARSPVGETCTARALLAAWPSVAAITVASVTALDPVGVVSERPRVLFGANMMSYVGRNCSAVPIASVPSSGSFGPPAMTGQSCGITQRFAGSTLYGSVASCAWPE